MTPKRCRPKTNLRFAFAVIVGLFCLPPACRAGVGPEHVILVVNGQSSDSRTVANHYIDLRSIPETNVIVLDGVPAKLKISLDEFKTLILLPVLKEIEERKISENARVIAYSAGFPTSVDISPHTAKLTDPTLKKYQLATGSINGLTMLYQFVLSDNPSYLDFGANLYARGPFQRFFRDPFIDASLSTRYYQATQARRIEDFAGAAEMLSELWKESPTNAALAIQSAECFALAGQKNKAIEMVAGAIAGGWQSGKYLNESEALAPIAKDAKLAAAVKQLSDAPTNVQGPIGFRSEVVWTKNGEPAIKPEMGIRYMMSCVLAVVHPRGSTVDQAVEVLKTAKLGDATFPDAAFYFTSTGDVRAKTRLPAVTDALLWLKTLDARAEIARATLPNESGDCVGLMVGTASATLATAKFKLVPGSIADNLTSLGAAFGVAGQTKLTDFLHAGAAMSSGAVTEPYSLPFKFPSPIMYGYYASGATAIEAFSMSVMSPYQLLIVGDPLAAAYLRAPNDRIGISLADNLDGSKVLRLARRPSTIGDPQKTSPVGAIELAIDGRTLRRFKPTEQINLNLKGAPPGMVNLRVSLVGRDPLMPVNSGDRWMRLSYSTEPPVATIDETAKGVRVEAKDATQIDFVIHGKVVQTMPGPSATFVPDRATFGNGPLRVRPIAVIGDVRVGGSPVVLPDAEAATTDETTPDDNTSMPALTPMGSPPRVEYGTSR